MATSKKQSSKSASKKPLPADSESTIVDLNFDNLTFEDLDVIQQGTGLVMADLAPEGKASAKGLAALVWLEKRKTNPNLQFDSVMKMPISRVIGSGPGSSGQRAANPPTTPRG